jgi:hypothetical protein
VCFKEISPAEFTFTHHTPGERKDAEAIPE